MVCSRPAVGSLKLCGASTSTEWVVLITGGRWCHRSWCRGLLSSCSIVHWHVGRCHVSLSSHIHFSKAAPMLSSAQKCCSSTYHVVLHCYFWHFAFVHIVRSGMQPLKSKHFHISATKTGASLCSSRSNLHLLWLTAAQPQAISGSSRSISRDLRIQQGGAAGTTGGVGMGILGPARGWAGRGGGPRWKPPSPHSKDNRKHPTLAWALLVCPLTRLPTYLPSCLPTFPPA